MKKINTLLKKLRKYGVANNIPNITDTNARFLRDIIKIKKPKNILEIGTANAYSTICLGIEAEKIGAKIKSIDFSIPSYKQALENIKEAKLDNSVELIFGNALDIIPDLKEKYDFVFIDGMKRKYKDFLEIVWKKIPTGGVIIMDDVIKFEDKMPDLWTYLENNKITYNIIPIDIDDGICMIIKP